MKLLTLAALAATLLIGAENSKTGELVPPSPRDTVGATVGAKADADALSPEQLTVWRTLNNQVAQANQALTEKDQAKDKALVAFYEARDAAQKAYSESNAVWLKLLADSKRDGFTVDPKTMRWVKLPTPVAQSGGK